MGYWCTLHLFDDKKFYQEHVPILKGKSGDLKEICLEFLKMNTLGGLVKFNQDEIDLKIEKTIYQFQQIYKTLNPDFKTSDILNDIKKYDDRIKYFNEFDGYYDFCKFLEFYIFSFCSDFYPHLPLGKGGVSRNFELDFRTLSSSIIGELDTWNEHLCPYGTGITSWISSEEVELLYLDKENLFFEENFKAKSFIEFLEIAKENQLGLIIGVDMNETILKQLPCYKLLSLSTWENVNHEGLLWKM